MGVTYKADFPWKWVSGDLSQDATLGEVLDPTVDRDHDKDISDMLAGFTEICTVENMEDKSRPQVI